MSKRRNQTERQTLIEACAQWIVEQRQAGQDIPTTLDGVMAYYRLPPGTIPYASWLIIHLALTHERVELAQQVQDRVFELDPTTVGLGEIREDTSPLRTGDRVTSVGGMLQGVPVPDLGLEQMEGMIDVVWPLEWVLV